MILPTCFCQDRTSGRGTSSLCNRFTIGWARLFAAWLFTRDRSPSRLVAAVKNRPSANRTGISSPPRSRAARRPCLTMFVTTRGIPLEIWVFTVCVQSTKIRQPSGDRDGSPDTGWPSTLQFMRFTGTQCRHPEKGSSESWAKRRRNHPSFRRVAEPEPAQKAQKRAFNAVIFRAAAEPAARPPAPCRSLRRGPHISPRRFAR